jgi:very-short-patch-repair endonuclease
VKSARAREFRRKTSVVEERLWEELRDRAFQGVRFRRRHPLGPFIAGFYSAEHRLVIEIDGAAHSDPNVHDHDQVRDGWLQTHGIHTICIPGAAVMYDIDAALAAIARAITLSPSPVRYPSPARRERGRAERGGEGHPLLGDRHED